MYSSHSLVATMELIPSLRKRKIYPDAYIDEMEERAYSALLVAIRNVRRDANHHLKELLKKKLITEDDDKRGEDAVQKSTDRHIGEVDKLVAAKEKEIMQV